jgi:hypothetical protein
MHIDQTGSAYCAAVAALRRERFRNLGAAVSLVQAAGALLVEACVLLPRRTAGTAAATFIRLLFVACSVPFFLVGSLIGSDWYATARRPARRGVALSLLVAAGALHQVAILGSLQPLLPCSARSKRLIPLSDGLILGALCGWWFWLVFDRAELFAFELPLLATKRMTRLLSALRSLRHPRSPILGRSYMPRIVAGFGLFVIALRVHRRASLWANLFFLSTLMLSACLMVLLWSALLQLVQVWMTSPATLGGNSSLGSHHRGKRASVTVARFEHALRNRVAATLSLSPQRQSTPKRTAIASGAGEELLCMVLEHSIHFGHVDMFLYALYDLERVALFVPERRRRLFADPHGRVLLALLDICLAILEPGALVERYTAPKDQKQQRLSRTRHVYRLSNAGLLHAYRMTATSLGALILHSSHEDPFGLVQRRTGLTQQRLEQLAAALTAIRSRCGTLRPRPGLEQAAFNALCDTLQRCRAWAAVEAAPTCTGTLTHSSTMPRVWREWPTSIEEAARHLEQVRAFLTHHTLK